MIRFTKPYTLLKIDSLTVNAECYSEALCAIESTITKKMFELIKINLLHMPERGYVFLFRSNNYPRSYPHLLLDEYYILLAFISSPLTDTIALDSCKTMFYYQNDSRGRSGKGLRVCNIATGLKGNIILKETPKDSVSGLIDFQCEIRSDFAEYDMKTISGSIHFNTSLKTLKQMKQEIFSLLIPYGLASAVHLYDVNYTINRE